MERIRIETGSKVAGGAGGTTWTTTGTDVRWCDVAWVPTERAERYQSVDGKVDYEFRFHDWPTVTMASSRFVWVTNGHPNALKVFYPVKPPTKVEGQRRKMVVLVRESTETGTATVAFDAAVTITARGKVDAVGAVTEHA
jgi:hypothetical protein